MMSILPFNEEQVKPAAEEKKEDKVAKPTEAKPMMSILPFNEEQVKPAAEEKKEDKVAKPTEAKPMMSILPFNEEQVKPAAEEKKEDKVAKPTEEKPSQHGDESNYFNKVYHTQGKNGLAAPQQSFQPETKEVETKPDVNEIKPAIQVIPKPQQRIEEEYKAQVMPQTKAIEEPQILIGGPSSANPSDAVEPSIISEEPKAQVLPQLKAIEEPQIRIGGPSVV